MKTRQVVCMIAVLLLILAGCGKQSAEESTTAAPETTVEVTTEPTVTEESIPGVEDSIFDDETIPMTEETQSQTEGTDPAETTKPTDSDKSQETTKPTEADKPQGITPPTEAPKPAETTKPTEAPKPTETTKPTEPSQPSAKPQTEYENFQNMNASQQQSYMESFDSIDDFFNWYNDAKAEHEAVNPPIDVGDGSIDMGDLMD